MGNNDFGFEWEFSPEDEGGTFIQDFEQSLMLYEQDILQSPPPMYQVLLLNDSDTPMDFVTFVLQTVFYNSYEEAERLTLQIHQKEMAICGVYTRDVAETKITSVIDLCNEYKYPLKCVMQREMVDVIKKS